MEKLFEIIYEDDDLLVVNKPAGLVCHPTKNGELSSLIGRARLHLNCSRRHESAQNPNQSELTFAATKPHLANRLDRETSGVVLIAKNSEVAGELGKALENRAVQKEYLAIVQGHVRDEHGLIDAPLGKDEHSKVAVKDCVRTDGATAQTEFWVERRFNRLRTPFRPWPRNNEFENEDKKRGEETPFTLLRIIPHTGRKHQIRIHLAHIGHSIVGDKLYGSDEDLYLALVENRLTEEQRAKLIFPNHALHARAVRFNWRGQSVEFFCAPEKWFTAFSTTDKY